ncbi:MAG: PQQ-binding-like beta-propeller repeat protein, partial [Bacteroidetes bacterium]|nr:PQQ-binding-like beta-propeller repeat protein [Bacteroidota bacterium]
MTKTTLLIFLCLIGLLSCKSDQSTPMQIGASQNWAVYGGDFASSQYSTLDQINTKNVANLKLAWSYSSGDKDERGRSQIQCNPLIIDGVLYGSSPKLKFFALDAATGKERWSFDPFEGNYNSYGMGVNRGVAYWTDGSQSRILLTAASSLYSIDAKTGKLDKSFGEAGTVSLHAGLGEWAQELYVVSNTPGIVYKNLLILGTRVSEGEDAAPGYIRAFDIPTGELKWVFHTIPRPGEFGYETWPEDAYQRIGGANAWSGMSLDPERGIVFVPTGSASYDFYGGNRHGENLFANSVLALDAATGKRIWHFQTVHHDMWDRDLPCAPNLVTVTHNGQKVDAVAQVTKSGFVFLLDRETGEPLFSVEEKPFPASDLDGEQAWPTQPIPVKPPPFSRQILTKNDIGSINPETQKQALKRLEGIRSNGQYIPPSREGTVIFPGFDGG